MAKRGSRTAVFVGLVATAASGCGGIRDAALGTARERDLGGGGGGLVGGPGGVVGRQAPPSTSLAAAGTVATSVHYIHVGLTGQGMAIGESASADGAQVGGATRVLGR